MEIGENLDRQIAFGKIKIHIRRILKWSVLAINFIMVTFYLFLLGQWIGGMPDAETRVYPCSQRDGYRINLIGDGRGKDARSVPGA